MKFVRNVGSHVDEAASGAGFTVNLGIRTVLSVGYLPRRLRFFLDSAYIAGVRSLPVTMIVALFAGMILALQTGIELQKYGQSGLIGNVVALSICREMGPFMTAVILAATVGSAIAAEIGTMKVSDEITALDVMSIDATNFLVLPRVAALTIMCTVLTVFTNAIGIAGGAIIGVSKLGVTANAYWISVEEALLSGGGFLPKDVYVGLFKAVVFGLTISLVSCAEGLRASGGALGVGRAVQRAVMVSVILVIIFGFIITTVFYDLTT